MNELQIDKRHLALDNSIQPLDLHLRIASLYAIASNFRFNIYLVPLRNVGSPYKADDGDLPRLLLTKTNVCCLYLQTVLEFKFMCQTNIALFTAAADGS